MRNLELFIAFLKIGALSFGGGYAMIPFFKSEIALHNWVPAGEYEKLIALAQVIPGPFAIDSSAYIGFMANGLIGAVLASIALCLPSFLLSVLIARFYVRFNSNNYVRLGLDGIKPAVTGLLISAVYIIGLQPLQAGLSIQNPLPVIKGILLIAAGYMLLKFTKINTFIFFAIFAAAGIVLF